MIGTNDKMEVLDRIKVSGDVKDIEKENIDKLCIQIRKLLIDVVTMNGGHLASNLGIVELTVALHRCLDLEKDKIVFDVGHQSYVHKILTGRKDCMVTMGNKGGLNCFPDECESIYDIFNTGHASTSISAALGIEKSMKLKGIEGQVVAIIGDGALAGGMVYEALNNASDLDSDILIILNDNEMSISRNVGAMSRYLSKLRLRPSYIETNTKVKNLVKKLPNGGKGLIKLIQKTKRALKSYVGQKMMFEDLDIRYIGPVDGHDEQALEEIINETKKVKGPKLLHVITTKGKGYDIAEKDPVKFHGVKNSLAKRKRLSANPMYNEYFGRLISDMAKKDENIVCVCPAMTEGSGLYEFSINHKDRYFDVGICEQHAVTFSAGLSKNGLKPICVIYSTFLQRAYDQILHDVCMTNKKVVICVDRAGVTDAYGKTHQGIYDVAFLSTLPNMTILAPESKDDMKKHLNESIYSLDGCIAIRYPYDEINSDISKQCDLDLGPLQCAVYNKGKDKAILCYGRMVPLALEAAKKSNASVVKIRKLYPIDNQQLYDLLKDYKYVICAEDVIYNGSVAQRFESWMYKNNKKSFRFENLSIKEDCEMRGCVDDILADNNLTSDALSKLLEDE